VARCSRCRAWVLPPDLTCPACRSTDPAFVFEPVSGRGAVRSWTVMRQSFLPGFADEVPFLLVDVELDLDGQPGPSDVRMIGRLLDGPDTPVRLGAPVTVAFEDVADGLAVPAFRLDDGR
jgi:hypothetical protein